MQLALERWPRVVELVKARRPTLAVLLSSAAPVATTATGVVVAFASEFNRKRADTTANRKLIEDGLRQELGRPDLRLTCAVQAEGEHGSLFEDQVLNYAARTFGGQPQRLSSAQNGDVETP